MSNEFTAERPPLLLKLSDGKEIKMTYGLEMDLRRILPDPETAMNLVLNDSFTQDYVVRRCLTEKKAMITDESELVSEVDITPDDTEAIIQWAVGHVLYFFVKRATGLADLSLRYQVTPPVPSANGSKPSALMTQSAGPSE